MGKKNVSYMGGGSYKKKSDSRVFFYENQKHLLLLPKKNVSYHFFKFGYHFGLSVLMSILGVKLGYYRDSDVFLADSVDLADISNFLLIS